MSTRSIAAIFGAVIIVLGSGVVSGQTYPNKPVRIVTSGAGGGSDFTIRLIAQTVAGPLGQQVVVENRPGIISVETVAKAAPDGYTLLFYGSTVWIEPLLREDVPWDPFRDFAPITLVGNSPNLIVVHPSLPVKSVKELISLAKARPGQLNYSSSGWGTSTHLGPELFKHTAGVNLVHVPYKSSGDAIRDLIAGEVQMMFATAGAASPHVKSARLRALAVTSEKPTELAPGLPTVAESGLPGFEMSANYELFAPAKTPAAIINRLHDEVTKVVARPDVKEKLLSTGIDVYGSTPQQLADYMKSEVAKWGKVIKAAGIRAK